MLGFVGAGDLGMQHAQRSPHATQSAVAVQSPSAAEGFAEHSAPHCLAVQAKETKSVRPVESCPISLTGSSSQEFGKVSSCYAVYVSGRGPDETGVVLDS